MKLIFAIGAAALLAGCHEDPKAPTDSEVPKASIEKKEDDPPLPKPIRGCMTSCMGSAKSELENCKRNTAKVGADPFRCQIEYDQKVSDCNDTCSP
ncbi:MAG: hypothetical protein ACK554_03605 [Erythrobacteraceae bacterium]|jgi:hypothetical protein